MTTEAGRTNPAKVSLPGVLAYLSSVSELGRRSLRPALPALAFLFLYRMGTGAYGALTNYSEALKGHALGGTVVSKATPILLLALIYIPFLPLQESILRGHPIRFLEAIRRVFQEAVNLIFSGLAQVLILLGPIGPMVVIGARLLSDPFGPLLLCGVAWMAIAAFFMIFATPAVLLDGEGPLLSLRTSFLLVWRNLGSAMGRLFVLVCIAFVGLMIASPLSSLGGNATAPVKIAVVTWTTAVETLLYPFWTAAILVLYRSLRPWTDEAHVSGAGPAGPAS